MKIIAVDPGNVTGIAIFQEDVLKQAFERRFLDFRVESVMLRSMGAQHIPDRVVIEIPQVYPVKKWKGDPNDLIKIAVHVGIMVCALAPFTKKEIELIKPREWKGQLKKELDHARTLAKLGQDEYRAIEKIKSEHILDAIGIGLWALGRR